MNEATDYIGQMPDDFVDSFEEAASDDLLIEFVNLDREKTQIENRLDEIKNRSKLIAKILLDEWANLGMQSVKLKHHTVYIRNDFYCSKKAGVETRKVCDALKENGYDDMVNPAYSPATLKALVREMVDNDQTVPAELVALIQFDTVPRLMARAT